MGRSAGIVGAVVLLALALHRPARAEDSFWGDTFTRPTLAANWGGVRDDAAAKGIRFDASLTQIGQGVVGGGKDRSWAYGGRANLTANLDTQKLGLWPGGFLTVEFESNWEESVNGDTGALIPVNTNQLFPVPSGDHVALPQLTFAQFVSPYAGAVIGKVDFSSADANEFAHGKGDTQFFNLAFNLNPVALLVPSSTLAAGLILRPQRTPLLPSSSSPSCKPRERQRRQDSMTSARTT